MLSRALARRLALLAPVVVGVAAFVAVEQLMTPRDRGGSIADPGLEIPVQPRPSSRLPLQVAVHDLLESARSGPAVRVCRRLAERTVTLVVTHPVPLREVLTDLARQAGARLVVATTPRDARPLPTIACPTAGDYLTIGN
jgi:hypothetical protein